MKQQILHFLLIVILSMAYPFNASGDDYRIIDFNYPQEVSKEALADLDNALKAGDGELTVDALVRYSIAQSGISKDNMPDIVKRLESTIAKEKRPHIKALLYYFEAMVYQGYSNRYARRNNRNNPVEEVPADVSEWDRNQFNKKIAELVEKSLAEPEALKAVAVTSLPGIIECNELGATYVPTLFEFLSMKSLEMLRDNDELVDRIKTDWLNATDGHAAPNMYAMVHTGKGDLRAAYDRYRNSEYCAIVLSKLSFDDNKQKYAELKQYLKHFPFSVYATQVKNMIFDLEEKRVNVSYPDVLSSRDMITVTADVNNANTYWLNVYRAPDDLRVTYRIEPDMLKFVSQTPVAVQGNVPFRATDIKTELPPLPYGHYVILPMLDKDEKPHQDVSTHQLLRITDIGNFSVCRQGKECIIAAVDITTGKPLPDVTVVNKYNTKIGNTSSDGTLKLSGNTDFRTVKGNDRFGPENYYYQISDRSYDAITAQFYSDLGVYRPGETVHWAIIVYRATNEGNTPLGGKEFKVIFKDPNYKDIETSKVVSDEYGRIEGSFVIPKDRMNGRFNINLEKIRGWSVNVSEYKTPTFEVTFPDARRSYVAGQPVKVTGKAMNYSGVPIANSEVRLSLIQNQWSWWWWSMRNNNGKHLLDTTVVTDAQGNFTIEFAPDLFTENKDLKPGKRCWARYNYEVLATVTNDAGETHEESTSFIVGTRRGIELGSESENIYLNDQPIKLPLKYNTTDEEHPDTWCTWEVTKKGCKEPALTGNLNTSDPTIDLTSLSSGEYTLKIHILDAEEGEQDVDVSRDIILYRKGDKTSPVKDCPLWISPFGKSVDKNNKGHITVGVSTPEAYIYYVASTNKDIIGEGWLNYQAGINDFTVPLPKEAGADVTVSFITYYGTKKWEKDVKLTNPYQAEALKITATSFRDKLVPGNIERWSFTLTDQHGKPRPGAMLLDMYDKAIASIAENGWKYSLYSPYGSRSTFDIRSMSLGDFNGGYTRWSQDHLAIPKEAQAQLPKLYTYNQRPFSYTMGRGRMMMKTQLMGAARRPTNATEAFNNTVTGIVVDENDEPVIGASVQIIGENGGCATDIDGMFSLTCAMGATLKISYVGYETVEVQALDGMVIELVPCDAMLEEVVVTGYQKVDKRLFTGSVQSEELADSENAFGVASKIRVRGAATEDAKVNQQNLDKVTLRESDVKTALWMPMLTSDQNGVISLEFEVPNFNTTWNTQAVAWDKKMVGSTWMAEVLTQKPLMVKANMPRFLRQGDKATLAATVQNSTDEAAACDAVIELFDPRTNEVYATRKFNLTLDPMGSEAVTIDWQVPDTVAMVGFRIKAANSTFGDGEQVMVPVLTTISPVIETQPFYVEAGQGHFEQPLSKFPKDARVTLEYCDNPVWYCVLALPTIFSDEYKVATCAAHSLFALQVAQGVAKSQPQIKEAITYWKQHNEDSALVSMLQKNQDLKIGTLLASPWVSDADRQTLRMSKLNELFDEAIVKKEYEKIITALKNLQMGDGGFTWFRHPYCRSNVWTTGAVLELIGETKRLGYLPEDKRLTDMVNRALSYYDTENVRLYNEAKKNNEAKTYSKEPEGKFTDYAYIRSLFPEVKQTTSSADLLKKVLIYMDKNWSKGITLKQKAYYAMTLNRNGYKETARSIVESIRQFAIVKPNLGMYWDNLQTDYGWWEFDKVAYTSTILQAMNEVDPRQQEIDQVRKWMLLMKQSNDWGTNSLAADAVYSILSTGSQWLERGNTPSITIAGQSVNLDKMAQYVGYFRTTLSATTAGDVVIDRTASGPAWGAVYSQFKAPMTEIKEKAIEEVSISKEYYVYAQDGSLHQTDAFKVGDKVKVRVVIKTNKDMDFVTITDERAACFEPVDQLSGYRSEDRTWFYQETKDTQTNVFINGLRKGTHIIGYDVWVTNPGEFTSGIATIQSQYAPQLSAHSAGKTITALPKD